MTQTEIKQRDALVAILDNDELEGFEAEFVESMRRKDDDVTLSEKQSDKLEQIYKKHCED